MGLKTIPKSANVSREQLCQAVRAKAVNISIAQAEAKLWNKPEVREKYEKAARLNLPKRERRFANQTRAKAVIDNLARKRMKRAGQS